MNTLYSHLYNTTDESTPSTGVGKFKSSDTLVIAHRKPALRADDTAQFKLVLQCSEDNLQETDMILNEYEQALKEMMFMTSHRVRQPLTQILGITNVIDHSKNSPEELAQMIGYLKESALALDQFTKELTNRMCELDKTTKSRS